MKLPLVFIKLFILFYLPFNTALAGEIYSTSFESGSISNVKVLQNGFSWGEGTYTSVSSERSKSGNYSLKFRFKATPELDGDSWSEQRFNLGGYYPDIWIKYDLFIPGNYVHRTVKPKSTAQTNNKGHIALWAGKYSNPGAEGPALLTQLWSAHWSDTAISQAVTTAISSINDVRVLNNNYNDPGEENGRSSKAIVESDRGHWMTIVIHAKYATTANNDGVFEIWKTDWKGNTIKLIDIQDGPWYGTQPNGNPARGFEKGYLLGWANSGFEEETILYLDNITFSTSPLNNDTVTNYLAPPKPPAIMLN